MPIYNRFWTNPAGGIDQGQLLTRGPALSIEIGVTKDHAGILIAASKPVPASQNGTGLIDTGAGLTAVDVAVLAALGLNPISTTPIWGPTGTEEQGVYMVQISFLGTDLPPIDQPVVGSQLQKFGHLALLGRPLLQGSMLVYDGKHEFWTLAF